MIKITERFAIKEYPGDQSYLYLVDSYCTGFHESSPIGCIVSWASKTDVKVPYTFDTKQRPWGCLYNPDQDITDKFTFIVRSML